MISDSLLSNLESSYEEFIVPLRMGEGFNAELFSNLCNSIRACSDNWASQQDIPKPAAMIFVDAFSSIVSCSHLYEEKEKIQMAADEMNDLIRECLE